MTMHHPFTHARRRQNVLADLASTGLNAANSEVIDDALRAVIEQRAAARMDLAKNAPRLFSRERRRPTLVWFGSVRFNAIT
ncbi:hypothetical protein O4328_31730 [Rhodococcus opacus]|uniref:Uncharacterized protein n=1 Tax=Rhodococcus opacus TaxID=37919 RepID=A0ABT4NLD8_RHOOP|nr:hypothetical protein [Rhodococcus opacus]MCZ4588196.1 hypothetical protein [Rhodococcus opacus]